MGGLFFKEPAARGFGGWGSRLTLYFLFTAASNKPELPLGLCPPVHWYRDLHIARHAGEEATNAMDRTHPDYPSPVLRLT